MEAGADEIKADAEALKEADRLVSRQLFNVG
jgi:hypothetical protein